MTQGTFEALHSKCMYGGGCTGPGCRVQRNYAPTNAPRTRTRLRKNERRLEARINDWDGPGRQHASGQEMHKPGSQH